MAATKYLSEDGVRRLWAAIEAKFMDADEIDAIIADLPTGTADMVALTNGEIDEITGYVGPLDDDSNENSGTEENTDPETQEPEQTEP